jgi:MFS family permease
MGQSSADAEKPVIAASLRTLRAAAVAGIAFSLLLGLALVLIRLSVPDQPTEAGQLLSDPDRRSTVEFALGLVPFAGIAFLWFIGVIRDRIGEREDRLFATVFLGSGLLFVGMLFVGAAVAGGLIAEAGARLNDAQPSDVWSVGHRIVFTLLNVYAMRMGGVFIITTASIGMRTRILPRWLGITGLASALILLFGVALSGWLTLLLPIWVLIVSVYILLSPSRR